MTLAKLILAAVIFGVIAVSIFLWAFQTWGVYRFPATDPGAKPNIVVKELTAKDGSQIYVWVSQPANGQPVIVSFHGNFTTISPSFERLEPLLDQGIGLVMLSYRGSGETTGHLNEKRMKADAETVYDNLPTLIDGGIEDREVFAHGYSLGSSPGTWLAANRPVDGLIFEAGYGRLYDYWERRYKGIPIFRFMWAERNENIDQIDAVEAPILFLHGAQDPALPVSWAREVYEKAKAPKRFVLYPDGAHANLHDHGMIEDVSKFVAGPLEFVQAAN